MIEIPVSSVAIWASISYRKWELVQSELHEQLCLLPVMIPKLAYATPHRNLRDKVRSSVTLEFYSAQIVDWQHPDYCGGRVTVQDKRRSTLGSYVKRQDTSIKDRDRV